MNWGNLTRVLLDSPWLEQSDDLSTPEGMIATAVAILDRMKNGEVLRTVSWRPMRLIDAPVYVPPPVAAKHEGPIGGATVTRPSAPPRSPSPAPAYAEIEF
jgi:hypothetical protein